MSREIFTLRPDYITTALFVFTKNFKFGVHKNRNHQDGAGSPRDQRDNFGYERGAHFRRRNRMADGDVPIGAHDRQEDAARELVDARRRHINLAHDVAERPEFQAHRGYQEGYADQETLVSNRQVDDIHVGDCLHFGETEYDVYDERVTEQADDADQSVEDLGENDQRRLVEVAAKNVTGVISRAVQPRRVVVDRRVVQK